MASIAWRLGGWRPPPGPKCRAHTPAAGDICNASFRNLECASQSAPIRVICAKNWPPSVNYTRRAGLWRRFIAAPRSSGAALHGARTNVLRDEGALKAMALPVASSPAVDHHSDGRLSNSVFSPARTKTHGRRFLPPRPTAHTFPSGREKARLSSECSCKVLTDAFSLQPASGAGKTVAGKSRDAASLRHGKCGGAQVRADGGNRRLMHCSRRMIIARRPGGRHDWRPCCS